MSPKPRFPLPGLLAACSIAASAVGEPAQPNVIVILADDLGAHELGVYGHPTHQTPHLDELARGGIYFDTAYATPVCHPSRHALMTGQYPHNNGVFHFPNRAGGPQVENKGDDNIAAHVTFGRLFQQAGYATAMAGKWQLSGELPDLVRETGFDEYAIWAYDHNLPAGQKHTGGREPESGRTSRYWHPSIVQNGVYRPTTLDDYGPDLFADFLIDFSNRSRTEEKKPFFLYYSMALPHAPYYPTPDSLVSPDDKFTHRETNWQANVEYLDKLIGRIISALETSGQRENTLIVFMSDNGTALNGKGTTTEMGARVPLILNGPGLVQTQGRSPELADITDILPTICEVAGIPLPPGHRIDGISLAPYLQGETKSLREWVYAPLGGRRTLRTNRWLLENNTPWRFGQLFDCGDSRNGTGYRDVTNDSSEEVQNAKRQLREIMASLPVPDVAPDDPRMIGREKPHYVSRDQRHGLNSPVIVDIAEGRATLTVIPPVDGQPQGFTLIMEDQTLVSDLIARQTLVRMAHRDGKIAGVLHAAGGADLTEDLVQAARTLVAARAGEFGFEGTVEVFTLIAVETADQALSSP